MDVSLNSNSSSSYSASGYSSSGSTSSVGHDAVVIHTNTNHAIHAVPAFVDSRYTNLFDFLFKTIGDTLKSSHRDSKNCYDNIAALHAMTLVNRHYFARGCAIFQVMKNNMMGIALHSILTPLLPSGNALLIPEPVRLIPGDVRKIHKDLSKLKMSLDDAIATLNTTEKDRVDLVVDALVNNCTYLLKFLLASGLNPNISWQIEDDTMESILDCAIEKNDVDLVKALIQAGADIKGHRTSDGKTPFMVAADIGVIEIMQALKDAGADINARDHKGHTALLNNVIANTGLSCLGSEEVDVDAPRRVSALLQLGVDTEISDPMNQYTALLYATISCMDISILEMLIQNGANILACDHEGVTVLMLAVQYCRLVGELDRVQLILQSGPHSSDRHMQYYRQAMLEARNHEGETALMYAVGRCKKDCVSMLIQAGANVNARFEGRAIREVIENKPHLRGLLR